MDSLIEVGGYTYSVANDVVTKANTSTGAIVWRRVVGVANTVVYSVRIGYSSGMVVVGGYECGSESDPSGYLIALRAADGTAAWTRRFDGGLDDFVISSGTVLTAGSTAGSGGLVAAWRVTDGSSLWQVQDCCGDSKVLVVGGVVVTVAADDATQQWSLRGLSLSTGAVRWTVNGVWGLQAGDLAGSAGHSLFVTTSHGRLDEFNPVTGAFVAAYPSTARDVLAVDATRVYTTCVTATISAGVCAYSRSSRALLWASSDSSALGAVGGKVLYLSDGTARNSATGAIVKSLWTGRAALLVEADSHVLAVLAASNTDVQVYGL